MRLRHSVVGNHPKTRYPTDYPGIERMGVRLKDYRVKEEKRGKVHGLRVHFDADKAPKDAISMMWDVEQFTRSFPDVLELEVLESSATHQRVRYVIDAKFKKLSYVLNRNLRSDDTRHEITWNMVKGDLRSVDGAWNHSARRRTLRHRIRILCRCKRLHS